MSAHPTRGAEAQFLEAAATRNFSNLFAEVKYAPLHGDLAEDIDRAMRELVAVCDGTFSPDQTHEIHAEVRDLAASMARPGFVSPERLAQFAQLRAMVEGLWNVRARNSLFPPARTPLDKREYTRMLLRLDLVLVRLKVQVLLRQMGE